MLPVTADELALRRGICESPADDVGRLAYADWLQERGELEWAEFIRVQVELARWPCKKCRGTGTDKPNRECGCGAWGLRGQERGLLTENSIKWSPELPGFHRVCAGWACHRTRDDGENVMTGLELEVRTEFHRGFVAELTLPWTAWAGGECGRCHGGGQEPFRVVDGPPADLTCPDCKGTGRTPGVTESMYWALRPCPGCVGLSAASGGAIKAAPHLCPRCSGSGRVVPTVECPEKPDPRQGVYHRPGVGLQYDETKRHKNCKTCSGTGRVPRPFPETAQPLERVEFTTWPEVRDHSGDGVADHDPAAILLALERRWPGIEFVMPVARE